MLARAEQLRSTAAAPVTPVPFAPFDQLRASLCYREIAAGLTTDAEAAATRIRRELIADAALWNQLAVEQQTEALFWSGHAAWFYEGDDRLALEQLGRAAQGKGQAALWADDYRHALGDSVEAHAGDPTWPALFASVLGAFRQVCEKPDYDLLVDPSVRVKSRTLDRATVERVRSLSQGIEQLEAVRPLDPFAQCALIYDIRAAQAATWPGEHDQKALVKSRSALEALGVATGLEPQRRFHLAEADLEPLTLAQIVVLPKADLRARIDELDRLSHDIHLPEHLRKRAADLAHRLYLPSVAWSNHPQQQRNQ
jgi:hypothetical protein